LDASYSSGDLILDRDYLEALSIFTSGQGELIMHGLPGSPHDWIIASEPEQSKPNIGHSFRSARLIMDRSSFLRQAYSCLVDMVIPLAREKSCGFSSMLARGAIFRSFHTPHTAATVALDVVHEMGHQALILLQSIDPLISSDLSAPVFSEIRKTDRPAIQSLHAAAALAYMLVLSRTMNTTEEERRAVQERSDEYGGTLAESLAKAITSLKRKCTFTQVGLQVIGELEEASLRQPA
jgi:HEXXH motif-containing protein